MPRHGVGSFSTAFCRAWVSLFLFFCSRRLTNPFVGPVVLHTFCSYYSFLTSTKTCVTLICLRMVKDRQTVLQGRLLRRTTRQNYPMSRDEQSKDALTSSRNSEPVLSPNLKCHGCSSEPSPTKATTKASSSQVMNHTLTCSTTSNTTKAATLTESVKFNSSFKSLTATSHQPLASDLTKPALLDRLSDHLHPNQMSGTASTQREPDWTTTRCCGMTRQSQSMAR